MPSTHQQKKAPSQIYCSMLSYTKQNVVIPFLISSFGGILYSIVCGGHILNFGGLDFYFLPFLFFLFFYFFMFEDCLL